MSNLNNAAYKNRHAPASARVEDLLPRMTVEEKVAQVIGVKAMKTMVENIAKKGSFNNDDGIEISEEFKEAVLHGAGAFQAPVRQLYPREGAIIFNILQKYVIENSRHGIPAMVHDESLNGYMARGQTVFPKPIGLACTFNPELIRAVFDIAGKEARARGCHMVFAPNLDVGRDPRWGRIDETFGEDTYLVTQMGLAAVRGLQGSEYSVSNDHVISCPKHFAGYAQSDGGRNYAPTYITERILRDEILPPFKAAVTEAGVMGIMPSHAEIDGIPMHANRKLLKETLREEWGFKGVICSDYFDIEQLFKFQGVAGSLVEAAIKGLEAEINFDLPFGTSYKSIVETAKTDAKVAELLDTIVRRVLYVKFMLGLFENPYIDVDHCVKTANCEKHKRISKKAADQAVVLLKNENSLLPLNIKEIKKIAVIGPNAHPVDFGSYTVQPNEGVSILDGIRTKVSGDAEVSYEIGCGMTRQARVAEVETFIADSKNPVLYTPEEDAGSISAAVEAAKKADVAVVCVGGSSMTSREASPIEGYLGDNADLELAGNQNELVKEILKAGTPTIVVLINGKPLACIYIAENAPAILEGWFLGQETGNAIADILFGDVNPSGKLSVTIARSAGHLPVHYSQKPGGLLKSYLFTKSTPLFPFGFGLSYTTFVYSNLSIQPAVIEEGQSSVISVDVTNTGDREGDEIVQLYIRDKVASVTRPVKQLKDFARVELKPDETKKVCFSLSTDKLKFTDINMDFVLEPGEFEIMMGKSSEDYLSGTLFVNK